MNFKEMYRQKLTTADQAVNVIEPNDAIVFPIMPGEPPALLDGIRAMTTLKGNKLYRMLPSFPIVGKDESELKEISIFLSGMDRKAMNDGKVDLLPNHFSDIPSILKDRDGDQLVIMATVSPMDEEGNFSLGTSPSYVASLISGAKRIVLEVNPNMPRTFGDKNTIHISQVDALIENDVDLPELISPKLSEKDLAIGKEIAKKVKDGDTLQIGFGAMPNAVMEYLTDKKHLGLHTEMLPERLVDLTEKRVIDNSHKEIHEGKSVATFAIGSKRLYEFMDNNPDILMLPCDYTNNFDVIKQMKNLVAINSSVEVDFLGQCNSERVKSMYYSSTGGQSDFMKGVRLTENGTGIICLYSTAKGDEISTIVPMLFEGAPVSTSKNDIDTVVTEYGSAVLKSSTISERTERLINIAHPKFRDELMAKAKELNYL
ncbi:acetyl-CoA hydrolase/transferase family protein [Vagococcus penaei]|uniref:4-hydroxybutyrate CoA-transferase n=1 Tax=Vagococcus penaei TaxID=633807 RepID=A0A1Q2D912_9ENTE|nr:acetyl-CoA hydrolase/transferase C-terminal domain-containing protein [Vagococcus penaei]AQP54673.1 4-hydroxybutyrate CoA-transferase [Vagococcus penaei]